MTLKGMHVPANVDLSEAHFGKNLQNVTLATLDLAFAEFVNSDLRGAGFGRITRPDESLGVVTQGSNLTGAVFVNSNLAGADLSYANLSFALFQGTDLTNANLYVANLAFAVFQPKPDTISSIRELASVRGLAAITYGYDPSALVVLRDELRRRGLHNSEREVTYAIRRRGIELTENVVEAAFGFIFFELTSEWGLYYGRPLRILGGMIPVFAIFYMAALFSVRRGGIWIVWVPDRVEQKSGSHDPERLTPRLVLPGAIPWIRLAHDALSSVSV